MRIPKALRLLRDGLGNDTADKLVSSRKYGGTSSKSTPSLQICRRCSSSIHVIRKHTTFIEVVARGFCGQRKRAVGNRQ